MRSRFTTQVRFLALLLVATALLGGCTKSAPADDPGTTKIPELPDKPVAARMLMIDYEEYHGLEIGPLPEGVTVAVEGYELQKGYGDEQDIYLLREYDLVADQNEDLEPEPWVEYKLQYLYQGQVIKEIPCGFEATAMTYIETEQPRETTTADSVLMKIGVPAGTRVSVNGVVYQPEPGETHLYRIALPDIGVNQLFIRVERPGEVPNGRMYEVTRLPVLTTDELKASVALIQMAAAVDAKGAQRPVTGEVMRSILSNVFATEPIQRPVVNPGDVAIGSFIVGLDGKEAELHIRRSFIELNGECFPVTTADLEALSTFFQTPYEWAFLPIAKPPYQLFVGPGVRLGPIKEPGAQTQTMLVTYNEAGTAALQIERIFEVSPGKFEIHVKEGLSAGSNGYVVLMGWDEQRQFTVKR